MTGWSVVPQVEYSQGEPAQVLCRHVRTMPERDAKTGETSFRLLPDDVFVLQVVVESDGDQYRLKTIENGGSVKYVWQHLAPASWHGNGQPRKRSNPRSAPRVPGFKAEFASREACVDFLKRKLDGEFAELVMELFRWRRQLCRVRRPVQTAGVERVE